MPVSKIRTSPIRGPVRVHASKIVVKDVGYVHFDWKDRKELAEEEDNEGYIPSGYEKILELSLVIANDPGKGQGDVLMKRVLSSPAAKSADLIFLDPGPGEGANFDSKMSDAEQVNRLVKFYKRYGFKHNPESTTRRMWLVRKGHLPDNELPT